MSKYGHITHTTIPRGEFFSKWDDIFENDRVVGTRYQDLKSDWKQLQTKKRFARDHPILHDVLMLDYLKRRIAYQKKKVKEPQEFIVDAIPQTYRETVQESTVDEESIKTSFSGRYSQDKEGEYDLSYDLVTVDCLRYKVIVEFKSNCNKGNKSDEVIEIGWGKLKESIQERKYKDLVSDGTVGIYFLIVKPFNTRVENGESNKIQGYLPEHISGFKEDVRTIILPDFISLPEFQTIYS